MIEKRLERFCRLFQGFSNGYTRRDRVVGPTTPGQKVNKTPYFVREPVTPQTLEDHLRGEYEVGLCPITNDAKCHFACIDIDNYQITDHKKLAALMEPYGGVVCSSKSGGAHIFFFFKEAIRAGEVRSVLESLSARIGYAGLSEGQTNIDLFPSHSNVSSEATGGKTVTLPMSSSYGEASPYPFYTKTQELFDLDQFLDLAEKNRLGKAQFLELGHNEQSGELFHDGPPCLQAIEKNGKLGDGDGRNNFMFNVGVYLIKSLSEGDPKDTKWENAFFEYNKRLNNPSLSYEECTKLIESLRRSQFNYSCGTRPVCNFCDRSTCMTRKHGVASAGATLLPHMHSMTKQIGTETEVFMTVDDKRIGPITMPEILNYSDLRKTLAVRCGIRLPQSSSKKMVEFWDAKYAEMEQSCETYYVEESSLEDKKLFGAMHIVSYTAVHTPNEDCVQECVRRGAHVTDGSGTYYFHPAILHQYLQQAGIKMTYEQMHNKVRLYGAEIIEHNYGFAKGTVIKLSVKPQSATH